MERVSISQSHAGLYSIYAVHTFAIHRPVGSSMRGCNPGTSNYHKLLAISVRICVR